MTNTRKGAFLTIKESCDRTGIHRTTIYRWRASGKLTRYEDGRGHPLIKQSELDALFAPRAVK